MINGDTKIIAHIGHPTTTFKAPMIYNPWFEACGVNAAVIPFGVTPDRFHVAFPEICRLSNFAGALITMPYKITVVDYLDDVSTAVRIAGACNAVRWSAEGRLTGDMFDGEGFTRGVASHGGTVSGRRVLISGAGGVGSSIAASCAAAGAAELALYDIRPGVAEALALRLSAHYPALAIKTGSNDPQGFDIVVNATPLGMNADDPLPLDPARLTPSALVADVVMKREITPFLAAAQARGCRIQIGLDMLFEQIPAYLSFFEFPSTSGQELRKLARIIY